MRGFLRAGLFTAGLVMVLFGLLHAAGAAVPAAVAYGCFVGVIIIALMALAGVL